MYATSATDRTLVPLPAVASRNRPKLSLSAMLGFLFLAVATCAAAAQSVSVVALPNGYYMQPDRKGQVNIVKRSGGTTLRGPIAAYTVYRHIVTGALGTPSAASRSYTNDLPFHGGPETRYFVLDTSNGKLETDLSAEAWTRRLQELGAPPSLQIYAPILAQ